MYSVVLATVLAAGGAAPDWGHGCYGCCGGCHGCWGCYGCCGGCYGCWGCHGCYGCCGGCYGCWGCHGCYGCWGCHGCCGGVVIYYSCHGCCGGCYGCYGCCGGVVVQPGQPYKPPAPKPDDKKKEETAKPNQATIIVQVPAEAKMFVDGNEANLTSTSRRFITPALEMGRDYFYTIRAEKTRKGEKVAESKRVVFRAGQTVKVNFGDMSTAKVVPQAAPASVTVRLPADARLSVDGIECPLTSATRTFNTPKLDPGQRYVYTLKAEIVREGQTRADSKRVFVEAGKKVDVDFTNLPTLQAASR